MRKEIWRDVTGYEGLYKVSTHGRVKSLRRRVKNGGGTRTVRERILKPLVPDGRCTVVLSDGGKARQRRFRVHVLVARAFIPNPGNKPEVNHKDLNPLNNHVGNLEWMTHAENMKHAARNGAMWAPRGEDSPRATVTADVVASVREMYDDQRLSIKEISRRTKLNYGLVFKLVHRQTWKHLP